MILRTITIETSAARVEGNCELAGCSQPAAVYVYVHDDELTTSRRACRDHVEQIAAVVLHAHNFTLEERRLGRAASAAGDGATGVGRSRRVPGARRPTADPAAPPIVVELRAEVADLAAELAELRELAAAQAREVASLTRAFTTAPTTWHEPRL